MTHYPRRNFTDDQLSDIAEMREGGRTYSVIAAKYDCSPGLVRWHCLKLGADDPKGPSRPASKMPMVTMRNGRAVRRYTESEDATLLRMRSEGATFKAIGLELDRRTNSLIGRLLTIGMNEQRRELAP